MAPAVVHKKPSSLTLKIEQLHSSTDHATAGLPSPRSPAMSPRPDGHTQAGDALQLHMATAATTSTAHAREAHQRSLFTHLLRVPKSILRARTLTALGLALTASYIVVMSIMNPPSSTLLYNPKSPSFTSSDSSVFPFSYSNPKKTASPPPKCTAEQLLRGKWTKRSPAPRTIQDVVNAYKYRPYKALTKDQHGILNTYETRQDGMYCAKEFTKIQNEQTRLLDQERLIKVAGWQWTSEAEQRGECEVELWDWKQVVKRLLMSRAGIVFLGDSITAQQYDSFALLLGNDVDKGPIVERVLSAPSRRLDAHRALFLDPLHPQTAELLRELEPTFKVPLDRLNRPIAQTIRSDFLVTEQDVLDLDLDQKHGKTRIRPTDYDVQLEQLVNYPINNNDKNNFDRDDSLKWMSSIIVTSVGNWWERYIDSSTSVSLTLIKFKQAMLSTFSNLDRISKKKNFVIVYRSVNRGTVDCETYDGPVGMDDLRGMDQIGQHAWYLKQPMADVWRSLLHNVTMTTTTTIKTEVKPKNRWINLDIVDMSYQRPDAHRFPPDDYDWNWAMWHLLQTNEPMH
ncbi:hypothetical protein OIV83_004823 [Microbotryomycetes sp. JL201]|nr:hypothetical protein OIV83_004823 [Microbotryomycetes sp. JL201]